MKYNKIENQVLDITDIFKKSEMPNQSGTGLSNQWPKNADLISVQTEV